MKRWCDGERKREREREKEGGGGEPKTSPPVSLRLLESTLTEKKTKQKRKEVRVSTMIAFPTLALSPNITLPDNPFSKIKPKKL